MRRSDEFKVVRARDDLQRKLLVREEVGAAVEGTMIQICLITHGTNLVTCRTDIPVCHFFLHHEWELLFGVLRYYHGVEGHFHPVPSH